MPETTKIHINTSLIKSNLWVYLIALFTFICPMSAFSQELEEEQYEYEYEYEQSDERYERNQEGEFMNEKKKRNPKDGYLHIGSRRRQADESGTASSVPGLGLPNFGNREDDISRSQAENKVNEQNESNAFTDPSKANDQVTPKDSEDEQTPSLPPDPDLPIDSGLYYVFAAGILYCSRKIYFNKKAA